MHSYQVQPLKIEFIPNQIVYNCLDESSIGQLNLMVNLNTINQTTNNSLPETAYRRRALYPFEDERLFLHAIHCKIANCTVAFCSESKQIFEHSTKCKQMTDCNICQKMMPFYTGHKNSCRNKMCQTPAFLSIKLRLQQQKKKRINLPYSGRSPACSLPRSVVFKQEKKTLHQLLTAQRSNRIQINLPNIRTNKESAETITID